MLGPEYFDGTRTKKFQLLKQMALGMREVIDEAVIVETEAYVQDLLVPRSVFDGLVKYDRSYAKYLLLWCRNIKVNRRVGSVEVSYPVIDGVETLVTKSYMLMDNIIGIFFLAKMYTEKANYAMFSAIVSIGGSDGGIYPGLRESQDDGQLKIMTDVILALDDVACLKEDKRYRILVIGSSHPGFPSSGKSYEVIARILPNSDVYLYDPANVNYEIQIGKTNFYYISGSYSYSKGGSYDVILDDAWIEGKLHADRDPGFSVLSAPHYSVKKFPYEEFPPTRIYYQLFGTSGREQRAVSRNVCFEYKPVPGLGKCCACDELRFLMRGHYEGLAEDFMSMHKRNCQTGQIRVDIKEDFFSSESWLPYEPKVLIGFKKFPWDEFDLPDVTMNQINLKSSKIVVSNFMNFPVQLVNSVDFAIIIHNGLYYSCDEDKARRYGFVPYVQSHPVVNFEEVNIENYNWMVETDRTRLVRDSNKTGASEIDYMSSMIRRSCLDNKIIHKKDKNKSNEKKTRRVPRINGIRVDQPVKPTFKKKNEDMEIIVRELRSARKPKYKKKD